MSNCFNLMKIGRKEDECGEVPWPVSFVHLAPQQTCILCNLLNRDPLKFAASCLICVVFEPCNNGKICFIRWIAIDFQKRFYPLMSIDGRIMFEECSYGNVSVFIIPNESFGLFAYPCQWLTSVYSFCISHWKWKLSAR